MAYARILWIALGFALAAVAQPPPKRWAGAEEYDLASQAMAERDLNRRIALLQAWAARFPASEFDRERRTSLALSFQQLGDPREALNQATETLVLYANDPSALLLISALGPTLSDASESERATVARCATKLLSIKLSPRANTVPPAQDPSAPVSTSYVDPETQRVLAFIQQLRGARGQAVEKDSDIIKRQIADAALEWAKVNRP